VLILAVVLAALGPDHLAQQLASALEMRTAPCPVETRDYLPSRVVTCGKVSFGVSQAKAVIDEKMAASGAPAACALRSSPSPSARRTAR
jgi:hypothetical protein